MRIITVSLIVGILIGWSLNSVVQVADADSSLSEGTIVVAQHQGSVALCMQLFEQNYRILDDIKKHIEFHETTLKNYSKDAFRNGVDPNFVNAIITQHAETLMELAVKYGGEIPNEFRILLHCPTLSTA